MFSWHFLSGRFVCRCLAAIWLVFIGVPNPLEAYPPLFSIKKTIASADVIGTNNGQVVVTGLNATGGVAGYVAYTEKHQNVVVMYVQGFYWDDTAQLLTKLPVGLGATSSMASCVNDTGMVAGVYWTTGDVTQQLGFVWQPDGTVTSFQSPDDGDIDSVVGINAAGQVIGTYFGADGYKRAFLWDGSNCTDLGDLGDPANSFVWPQAINNAGQVIGTVYTESVIRQLNLPDSVAFQWQNGVMSPLDSDQDFLETIAIGLNDAGEMIGGWLNPSPYITGQLVPGGFYWSTDGITDLGDLGGGLTSPVFINSAGVVSGTTFGADNLLHLFNWQDGTLTDLGVARLNADDQTFQITSVSEKGDVAGLVTDVNNVCQGFVWSSGSIYNLAAINRTNVEFAVDGSPQNRVLINDGGFLACAGTNQGMPAVFLFTQDSDGNGLPDGWEEYYFQRIGVDPSTPLSWNSSLTVLQAFQQGFNPVDYYNDQLPTLTVVSGTPQIGPAGGFAPQPLIVQVSDANGMPLGNAPVQFQADSGLLQASNTADPISLLLLTTDENGQARAFFQLPTSPNTTCIISASVESDGQTVSVPFAITSDDGTGTYTSPFAPTNFVSQGNPDGSLDMSWTNNTDDQTPVEVEIQQADGSWKLVATLAPGTASYHYTPGQ